MIVSTSTNKYWQGSAPKPRQEQNYKEYQYTDINVFRLKTIPDFSAIDLESTHSSKKSAQNAFVASLQTELLKKIAGLSYLQLNDADNDIHSGYSLRIIFDPSNAASQNCTEVYLVGRTAGDNFDTFRANIQSQANYIQSSLNIQPYEFEFDKQKQFNFQPRWLDNSSSLSCYEILKSEKVTLWLEEYKKYFYSPGIFQVNKDNDMIALFEQLQHYKNFNKEICIDLTIVPTKFQEYEKKTVSKYIEKLAIAAKGSPEDNISPDSNAKLAKAIFEDVQQRYFSNTVSLYGFRVFSPCRNTCQAVASHLAACCTTNVASATIIEVPDIEYAVKTLKEVNINDKACVPKFWDQNAITLDGFSGGPVTLKRIHRIINLDEASAFFRLPIPIDRLCPGLEYTQQVKEPEPVEQFPSKLEIEDIIDQYEELITEDKYIVGIGKDGQPSVSNFAKIPHRIVAGITGAGKTNFLTSVIYQFLYASSKIEAARSIYIADFKGGLDFYRIENVAKSSVKLVTKAEDLALLVKALLLEHQRRIELMIAKNVESLRQLREKCNSNEHRIVLIIDEAASISTAERKVRDEINKCLQELAAKSRVTGINIFYCSQRPTGQIISSQVSENIEERVIFRVSATASQLLLNNDIAAELPVEPKGRCVYRGSKEGLRVLATPYVPASVWNDSFLSSIPNNSTLIDIEKLKPKPVTKPVEQFPSKLEIEDIIDQYEELITEDKYVVGVGKDGQPSVSNFAKIPHRIVAGTTGAGKTNFLTSVIYQFLYASYKIKAERKIYIADFKAGFDYHRIKRQHKNVELVTQAEDLAQLLKTLFDEYETRLEKMIDEDVENLKELREQCNSDEHRIVLIIDEAASIQSAERNIQKEIEKYLRELAAKSRIVGINIFYCTQRPTLDVIPKQISDNIDERVIFRVSTGASTLLLNNDIAGKLPIEPKGMCVYKGIKAELEVLKTPFVPKKIWKEPILSSSKNN